MGRYTDATPRDFIIFSYHRQRTASGWTKLDYICDQEFSARKQRHYTSLTGFVPGLDSSRFSGN
jgi:hypothetical protein